MNYNLRFFSKKWGFGVEIKNNQYFARMYVYMSRVCIVKTRVVACIVFLKIVV